jgi:hypothetical protein
MPKNRPYKGTLSRKGAKKFSPNSGGIILPSPHIYDVAITNRVDDLIIIIDMKKLRPVFKKNYNYNAKSITTPFISLHIKK